MPLLEMHVLEPAIPNRWSVVFHRKGYNRFFSLIAMGRFKHVSAFAWLPEMRVWLLYDVGFRRTVITVMPDNDGSKVVLADLIRGNCMVTLNAREGRPHVARLGFFCTTAVKHLLGLSGGALRPDALFRLCVREGGEISDDESRENRSASRSSACDARSGGEAAEHHATATAG